MLVPLLMTDTPPLQKTRKTPFFPEKTRKTLRVLPRLFSKSHLFPGYPRESWKNPYFWGHLWPVQWPPFLGSFLVKKPPFLGQKPLFLGQKPHFWGQNPQGKTLSGGWFTPTLRLFFDPNHPVYIRIGSKTDPDSPNSGVKNPNFAARTPPIPGAFWGS